MFCQASLIREEENLKQTIIVQDAITDKTIQANPFNKRPKVIPLVKTFKKIFKK